MRVSEAGLRGRVVGLIRDSYALPGRKPRRTPRLAEGRTAGTGTVNDDDDDDDGAR